jgi:hypothetical protein
MHTIRIYDVLKVDWVIEEAKCTASIDAERQELCIPFPPFVIYIIPL